PQRRSVLFPYTTLFRSEVRHARLLGEVDLGQLLERLDDEVEQPAEHGRVRLVPGGVELALRLPFCRRDALEVAPHGALGEVAVERTDVEIGRASCRERVWSAGGGGRGRRGV